MFRDHETGYLIASVILVYILTGLGIWHEIAYGESETVGQHLVAFGQAAGSAIATTLIILGTFEVIMVFAERYRRRRFDEGREQGREEGLEEGLERGVEKGRTEGRQEGRLEERQERDAAWIEWLRRRDEAQRNNLPFDEPPPSERGPGQP